MMAQRHDSFTAGVGRAGDLFFCCCLRPGSGGAFGGGLSRG